MKTILLGLIAFVIVLGASCKKEGIDNGKSTAKTEVVAEKPDLNHLGEQSTDGGGIGGYPGGGNVYPHNTGGCYCGYYSTCHPTPTPNQPHSAACIAAGGMTGGANGTQCPGGNYCNPPH